MVKYQPPTTNHVFEARSPDVGGFRRGFTICAGNSRTEFTSSGRPYGTVR